jgi:hypothetical protein
MSETLKAMLNKAYWSPSFVASWIGILLPPAIYFYFVYFYSLNLPFADDFANLSQTISIFQSTNFNEALSIFFALENGHRVAFTRFVYVLSYALFGEIDFRILILIGNIPLALLLFLFLRTLKVSRSNLLYFIPVSILLFQLQFWKNMTWAASALQHQYILLFTGLTFYLLGRKSNPGLYSAFFFAVLSVFTHGGGWVTIFLGWIILLIQKSYQKSSIWAGGALLLGFFYFKNFHSSTNVFTGIQSLEGFKNFLMFYSAFLGSSLSLDKMYIAAGFGVILSFYLCYLTWDKYFEKNITVFMFMVYIFLNAILVAMARSGLAVENVFAPRYKIVSVILIVLVYMSLAERFSPVTKKWRKFVAIGIIFAATSYFLSFKPGKDNLETRNKSLTWLANQWVNTNHGFFFSSGPPGDQDNIPNSILLRAVESKFYKLPHELLNIPDQGYSSSVALPKTCKTGKPGTFKTKFSVISVGPESSPYLVRLEGMIHSPATDKSDDKASIHLILKSKEGSYAFETHPQHYLHGSVFFDKQSSNAGFIALIPFKKIEKGLYQIGFCNGESINFEDKVLLKN